MTQPDLFDQLLLSDARGGRKPAKPLTVEVERELTLEDLALLQSGASPETPQPGQALLSIRHSHHQLARLIVEGEDQANVALLTGYSPAYISTLKNDPAFRELLSFYKDQKDAKFVDVLDRLKTLGLSTLDELQRRLEEDPAAWKNRELMELADMTLGRVAPQGTAAKTTASGGGGGAPLISISFVSPSAEGGADDRATVIDITPSDVGA